MKRIALLVELPISNNFRKQVTLFGNLFSNSYEVDIVTATGGARFSDFDFEQLKGCSRLKNWLMNTLVLFSSGYRYLRGSKPDVLISVASLITIVPLAVSLGRLCHVPVIITLGGDIFGQYRSAKWWQKIPEYLLKNVAGRISLKLADKIVVMGPYQKERLIKMGFPEDKIVIIPPFMDNDAFTPPADRNDGKKKLGFPTTSKVILFVGRVEREKGAHILKRVAEEVGRQRKDILFCIVGDGEYRNELRELENVVAVGPVDFSEVPKYYQAADLLILPSLTEGLPNVIVEALSCHVPVVASGVGEIPWIVSNICHDWNDFANYILNGNWKLDALPKTFSNEEFKRRFEEAFSQLDRT